MKNDLVNAILVDALSVAVAAFIFAYLFGFTWWMGLLLVVALRLSER
jgi:hypothetical protein